jgi:hypothetical protein
MHVVDRDPNICVGREEIKIQKFVLDFFPGCDLPWFFNQSHESMILGGLPAPERKGIFGTTSGDHRVKKSFGFGEKDFSGVSSGS